ncbi:DUF2782 domain-containing protein [Chitinimonas sp.]|uniref:DUF2782 domain-containing protein n=1 Tax=Chitinimonas sp. TaxID=1934313 RepID=UPI0035B0ED11
MRNPLPVSLLILSSLAVLATEPLKPTPVPPPPPLPAGAHDDPTLEPEVTIVQKEDATVTEYRIGGRLYMQKVKPKVGPEYYLTDDTGTGSFVRRDTDPKVKPPMWVIKRF